MPIIGPVPQGVLRTAASRSTHVGSRVGAGPGPIARRVLGLFVFTPPGSRGITWSPSGCARAGSLRQRVTHSAWSPALLDAVDPARFAVRARRRARPRQGWDAERCCRLA